MKKKVLFVLLFMICGFCFSQQVFDEIKKEFPFLSIFPYEVPETKVAITMLNRGFYLKDKEKMASQTIYTFGLDGNNTENGSFIYNNKEYLLTNIYLKYDLDGYLFWCEAELYSNDGFGWIFDVLKDFYVIYGEKNYAVFQNPLCSKDIIVTFENPMPSINLYSMKIGTIDLRNFE